MIKYKLPERWIKYDFSVIAKELVEAKASIKTIRNIPYQRSWVESLQEVELKREVAGTSRIEGADFTDQELDISMMESPEELLTRSQKLAHAAAQTYRWIATIPSDKPIDVNMIFEIHRRIITGADDDHCKPGKLRSPDHNVTFGQPRHRGAEGGEECNTAFERMVDALLNEYQNHDPIIQAMAAHYHFAAIHPFDDGNGRTARALEALILQRAGLKDICFVSMSNYYYDEKPGYLKSLHNVSELNHDLTPFLLFALKGVVRQTKRILVEIRYENSKVLFRNLMYDLFHRLESPRKRVIADRQIDILKLLLENKEMTVGDLFKKLLVRYNTLKKPAHAMKRDLTGLVEIGTIKGTRTADGIVKLKPNLDWPTEITETEFFKRLNVLPEAKTPKFLEDI